MEDINSGRGVYALTLDKWRKTIIDVKKVMEVLRYKDVRSVLKWCEKNNVFVFSQGNLQVVNRVEFIFAFYKPFINHLKRTKENWKELFMGFVCGDVMNAIDDKRTNEAIPPKQENILILKKNEDEMKEQKPLIVNKKQRFPGLRPWCSSCSKEIAGGKCGSTGKGLHTCKSIENHMYKAFITVPKSGGKVKTRELGTQDIAEAIVLKSEFTKELEAHNYQAIKEPIIELSAEPEKLTEVKEVERSEEVDTAMLLVNCIKMYIDFLNNVGVPKHKRVKRTEKYVRQCETYFMKLRMALRKNHLDDMTFRVDQVNDDIVGMIHAYILEDLRHSNKTYNKIMSLYRGFKNWLIKKKKYTIDNYFEDVTSRYTEANTEVISKKEFDSLLSAISPENGWRTVSSGKRVNQYRPWLSLCFRLAIETGLRTEEYIEMRFSHINNDEKGNPLFIEVPNYKVNRAKGEETAIDQGKELKRNKKYVPITKGMRELLKELNYAEYKDTDMFLITPVESTKRSTLMKLASQGFTHYWKLTGSKRVIHLKNLRKTYITSLTEQLGDHANIVSDHSSIEVIKKNYQNRQKVVSMVKGFSVFNDTPIL